MHPLGARVEIPCKHLLLTLTVNGEGLECVAHLCLSTDLCRLRLGEVVAVDAKPLKPPPRRLGDSADGALLVDAVGDQPAYVEREEVVPQVELLDGAGPRLGQPRTQLARAVTSWLAELAVARGENPERAAVFDAHRQVVLGASAQIVAAHVERRKALVAEHRRGEQRERAGAHAQPRLLLAKVVSGVGSAQLELGVLAIKEEQMAASAVGRLAALLAREREVASNVLEVGQPWRRRVYEELAVGVAPSRQQPVTDATQPFVAEARATKVELLEVGALRVLEVGGEQLRVRGR